MFLVGDFVPQKSKFSVPDFGGELVLANLEGPVCRDGLRPIDKVGKHLHSSPFELAGRWAFTLANNHFMDYRAEGMRETKSFLKDSGFPSGGAGENEVDARQIMWLEEQGKRIAVICCCEHQFGFAASGVPGVAAQGDWVEKAIGDARKGRADIVIVSSHAGSESTKFVSPRLRAQYHQWIDAGADVIHGHHAHVPQGWETYQEKPIFYGLGNFVVNADDWADNPDHLWSLIAHLDFSQDRLRWTVEPSGRIPHGVGSYLEEANKIFADDGLLRETWNRLAREQYDRYYRPYLTFSSRALMAWIRRPTAMRLLLRNFRDCENHIDIIETAKEA